jgi:UTP-glucose-1-phosphate uridylyltransferase
LERFVITWRGLRQARSRDVTKAVIVAAGWQPRLLARKIFEQTLLPIIDEAVRAKLFDIFLVIPPNMPALHDLEETFAKANIRYVVQQEPLGIGDAVLAAKKYIEGEPFALLLADEIDTSRSALTNLVRSYQIDRTPIIAVDAYEEDEDAVLRHYGFAPLGPQKRPNVFVLGGELIEKPMERPASTHLRIAGRYILTPEVLRTLEEAKHSETASTKHDLTPAINDLWRLSISVLVYKLPQRMLSIAPYRDIIQNMSRHEVFNADSYHRS